MRVRLPSAVIIEPCPRGIYVLWTNKTSAIKN